MFRFKINFIFVALYVLAVCPAYAVPHPVIGDFDGDNFSDLSVALVDRVAGTTAWLSRLDNNRNMFWYFFQPADALVSGHYYGDQKYYPGIVRVLDAAVPLLWQIKNPAGAENQLFFGMPGDHVPNQADVDCDGITDLIVTRNGSPKYPGYKVMPRE